MRRVYDKGAKLASPADFPNLVPSSPVGHASIYLGLRGPVLATSDLDATAESAIVTAAELVAAGEGEAPSSPAASRRRARSIERCLGPICSGVTDRGVRSEGARVLLLEAEETAALRGAPDPRARGMVGIVAQLGGGAAARRGARHAPAVARSRRGVLRARRRSRCAPALEGSPWAEVPRRRVAARAGDHEGAGGFAAAAAVSALAAGEVDSALVVGRRAGSRLTRCCSCGPAAGVTRGRGIAGAIARRLPAPPAPPALPEPSLAEWQHARKTPRRPAAATAAPRTRRIALTLREPRTGRVLSARGAVAILPPRALRMILLGPGGTTALDLWIDGDRYRFAVPAIDLQKRGDLPRPARGAAGAAGGLPRVLAAPPGERAAAVARARERPGALRAARRRGDRRSDDLRAAAASRLAAPPGRSPGETAPARLLDEETVSAGGLGCAEVRYHQRSTGLDVTVICEGRDAGRAAGARARRPGWERERRRRDGTRARSRRVRCRMTGGAAGSPGGAAGTPGGAAGTPGGAAVDHADGSASAVVRSVPRSWVAQPTPAPRCRIDLGRPNAYEERGGTAAGAAAERAGGPAASSATSGLRAG